MNYELLEKGDNYRENSMRHSIEMFLPMLDRITIYLNTVMVILFAWGVYAVMSTEPTTYLYEVMSRQIYEIWVAMHVVSGPLVWAGQLFKSPRVRWPLQFAGSVVLFGMSLTYIIAIFTEPSTKPGDALYQATMFIGFGLCTIWLAIRAIFEGIHSEGLCNNRNRN